MATVCAQTEWPLFFSSALWRKYKLFLWIANIVSISVYRLFKMQNLMPNRKNLMLHLIKLKKIPHHQSPLSMDDKAISPLKTEKYVLLEKNNYQING